MNPTRFRTNVSKGQQLRVDREAGIIYGASAIQMGEASGHGMAVDERTLEIVSELGNANDAGMKMRFTHPGMCADGMGKTFARAKNFRVEGDKALVDVHLREYAKGAPDGDLYSYILSMAEEAPEDFGLSIVFKGVAVWQFADGEEVIDRSNGESRPKGATNKLPFARPASLHAVDAVDEPAANRDGLFAAAFGITSNTDASEMFEQLDSMCTKYGINESGARAFLDRYFASRQEDNEVTQEPDAIPAPEQQKEVSAMSEPIETPVEQGPETVSPEIAVAKALAEQKAVVEFGESHGIASSECFGKTLDEVKDIALAKLSAKANAVTAPAERIVVSKDAADKYGEGVAKHWAGEEGGIQTSALNLIRQSAIMAGENASMWSDNQVASFGMRTISYSSTNKSSGMFASLLGNTANKQLQKGFDEYAPIWASICTVKDAQNFNSHTHAGLSTGKLHETGEGEAFEELIQGAGSYSTVLKNQGATVSLTIEMLMADELNQFMTNQFRAGYASSYTIDYNVFKALLNATWTNDTTTGAALGTAGNLDKVRSGLKGKLSPAGNKMNAEPRILVCDPTLRYAADLATGALYGVGTGGNAMAGSNATRSLMVADSSFVGDTSLLAGVLATTYYLFANPVMTDTITLEFLRGQRRPVIEEFDAGAADARKWKIKLPHAATVATHTDSASNVRVSGIKKQPSPSSDRKE